MATALDKIRAFKKAYMDLVEEWDSNSVMEDLDHKEYPFDKSFDELGVVDWCDDLEEQLTIMPHGKALHDFATTEIDMMIDITEEGMDEEPYLWDYAIRTVELYRKQFSISLEESVKYKKELACMFYKHTGYFPPECESVRWACDDIKEEK
jgi:hypothetical protein